MRCVHGCVRYANATPTPNGRSAPRRRVWVYLLSLWLCRAAFSDPRPRDHARDAKKRKGFLFFGPVHQGRAWGQCQWGRAILYPCAMSHIACRVVWLGPRRGSRRPHIRYIIHLHIAPMCLVRLVSWGGAGGALSTRVASKRIISVLAHPSGHHTHRTHDSTAAGRAGARQNHTSHSNRSFITFSFTQKNNNRS